MVMDAKSWIRHTIDEVFLTEYRPTGTLSSIYILTLQMQVPHRQTIVQAIQAEIMHWEDYLVPWQIFLLLGLMIQTIAILILP